MLRPALGGARNDGVFVSYTKKYATKVSPFFGKALMAGVLTLFWMVLYNLDALGDDFVDRITEFTRIRIGY